MGDVWRQYKKDVPLKHSLEEYQALIEKYATNDYFALEEGYGTYIIITVYPKANNEVGYDYMHPVMAVNLELIPELLVYQAFEIWETIGPDGEWVKVWERDEHTFSYLE